jgi:hypothetical protein
MSGIRHDESNQEYTARHGLSAALEDVVARALKERPPNCVECIGNWLLEAAAKQPVLQSLAPFDDNLAETLAAGHMRLLAADALRAGVLPALARRQELEEREAAGGGPFFLSSDAAVTVLRAADRRVCFLSHGWRSCVHPDPDGAALAALLRFLRDPLGRHVVGVFVDFACLHQLPRTAGQQAAFQQALSVMADGYASPLGTQIARYSVIPPCPAELAATIAVMGAAAGVSAETVRDALGGATASVEYIDVGDPARNVWRALLSSPDAAAAAVAAFGAAASGLGEHARAVRWWNSRAYASRGWCALESGVGSEAVARATFYPEVAEYFATLPAKVVELGDEQPVVASPEEVGPTPRPRIERIRAALRDEQLTQFTGHGDRDTVVKLFDGFVTRINNILLKAEVALGGNREGQYEGEFNAAGEREGRGVQRWAGGNEYDGEFKAGKREGHGVFRFATGDTFEGEYVANLTEGRGTYTWAASGAIFDGEYRAGKKHGPGTYKYADGRVDLETYAAAPHNDPCGGGFTPTVGVSVRWSADRQVAWRFHDGDDANMVEISLAEARALAADMSLPVPEP